ncbi:Phosphatidyl-N-methylethanolamine N-methyltransferase [Holothuria leucospilota]|uniref:Phosphatidylethanolamine N-methyltransferase n=1 Tax=Holothuria leucospilota TaxID=206669 RepID=A0A9Q0Y9K3_HOLLE|nr:Phosphatidyl-N-methylethanolamine N-methyltransferase [Holothuria leucospilota]
MRYCITTRQILCKFSSIWQSPTDPDHCIVADCEDQEDANIEINRPASTEVPKGARLEHNTKLISKLCGSAKAGCILLGATIIFFYIHPFKKVSYCLESQPYLSDCYFFMGWPVLTWIGLALIGWGLILGVSSLYVLGFYGTYLGDYFGILMDAKVTSFPFSVTSHPMYYGSWMQYLGIALWYRSPAGLLLCCLLLIAYRTAISFEGPFTEEIYRQRDIKVSGKKK